MAILEAESVSCVYGSGSRAVRAVDGVSFSLRPATTLGILGASGSGKSTLADCAGGLTRPSSGRVLFDGVDVARLDRAGRRRMRRMVQYVFQDPRASMEDWFTVERVLGEPLEIFEPGLDAKARRTMCLDMLERVGLPGSVLTKRPGELSGGQSQRVAIARALLPGPSVVICDECTSALDVSVQAQIMNLLNDIQRDLGCAYILISHDIGVVGYMSDEILVMNAGRAVEQGPAREVLWSPKDPYTKALLEAAGAGKEGVSCA